MLETLGKQSIGLGAFNIAQVSFQAASEVWRRLKTERCVEFARTVNNMGIATKYLGDYKKALGAFRQGLAIRLDLFGENNVDVTKSYNNIGVTLSDMGRFKESLVNFEKSVQIKISLNGGKQNLEVFNTYLNMAGLYFEMRKLRDAELYFENCRAIIPYLEKKEEPLSRLYNNLGSFYTNRKDFAQGIQYHEQAINLRIGLFTENHYLVARSYANLSGTYMEIGNLPKALSLAQKSLDIKLHVPQMDSSEIGASFITLGDIYTLLDDSARGMRNFQQAERIFMAQYGESHPYTGEVRNSMAAGFIQMGRPIDAMAYYQKALASYTAVNGSAAPDVQRVRISMALLYQSMGNLPSAVRLLDTVLTDIGWPSKRDNIHPDQCFNLFETLLFKGEMLSLMATSFAQRAEALKLLH